MVFFVHVFEKLVLIFRYSMLRQLQNKSPCFESNIRRQLQSFPALTGYPMQNFKYLRKIGPPSSRKNAPVRGSEIFAHRLPADAREDELFWFFQRAGDIYEIRLIMQRPSGVINRGYVFVRYFNPAQAQNAISMLSQVDFRPGYKILLKKSVENNRLFLSGIPLDKSKSEVWNELLRAGMRRITDVIMYKSHQKTCVNRGFVFIEFQTHEDAAMIKREYEHLLHLWNRRVILDWAEPVREVDQTVMAKVTRIFLRNLDVCLEKQKLVKILKTVLDMSAVEKVYKHLDYCFIHFITREMAERGIEKLGEYFKNTDVEVTWSKPPGVLKSRKLPIRLQKRSESKETPTGHNESHLNHFSEINMHQQNVHQEGCAEESNNTTEYCFETYKTMLQENIRRWWDEEMINSHNEEKIYENYQNAWDLWKGDFDWFDVSVANKPKNEKEL